MRPRQHRDDPQGSPPPAPAAFDRQGLLFTEFFFHSIDENDEKRAVSGARKSDGRSLRRRERRPASRSPTHGSPAASARASSVRPSGSASHEFFSAPSTTWTGTGVGSAQRTTGGRRWGAPDVNLMRELCGEEDGRRCCLPAKQQITNEPNERRTRYPHQAPPRDVRGPSSHSTHAHRAGPTRTRPRRELKLI